MIPPTLEEWNAKTEAQKRAAFRTYNAAGAAGGAAAGFAVAGPVGAIVGGVGGFFFGNWLVTKNFSTGW
jgi:glycerate kinase